MNQSTKKRTAIVVAVVGGAMAMGGVYATSLTLDAKQAAGGADAVAECQSGTLTFTSDDPTYDAIGGYYKIAGVTVSGITWSEGSGCDDQELYVTAAKADHTSLSSGTAVVISAASMHFEFTTAVKAADLAEYVAAITAPNA